MNGRMAIAIKLIKKSNYCDYNIRKSFKRVLYFKKCQNMYLLIWQIKLLISKCIILSSLQSPINYSYNQMQHIMLPSCIPAE